MKLKFNFFWIQIKIQNQKRPSRSQRNIKIWVLDYRNKHTACLGSVVARTSGCAKLALNGVFHLKVMLRPKTGSDVINWRDFAINVWKGHDLKLLDDDKKFWILTFFLPLMEDFYNAKIDFFEKCCALRMRNDFRSELKTSLLQIIHHSKVP